VSWSNLESIEKNSTADVETHVSLNHTRIKRQQGQTGETGRVAGRYSKLKQAEVGLKPHTQLSPLLKMFAC